MYWKSAHSKIKPIWDWWKALPEKNLPLFLIISAGLAAVCWLLTKICDKLFDTFAPHFQWRWAMNIFWVLVYLFAAFLCWTDYRKSKLATEKKLSFWSGWGVAVFFSVLFLIQKLTGNGSVPNPGSISTQPPASQPSASQSAAPCGDMNISDWPVDDQKLYGKAFKAGDRGKRDRLMNKMDDSANSYEQSYVGYFQLAITHPECYPCAAERVANLANIYSRLANRDSDTTLAGDAEQAIDNMPQTSMISTNAPGMKPALDLYNKLKQKHPDY
jgi:hypothetical protein